MWFSRVNYARGKGGNKGKHFFQFAVDFRALTLAKLIFLERKLPRMNREFSRMLCCNCVPGGYY